MVKKIWANCISENGLDGVPKGIKVGPQSEEARRKNSESHKGQIAWNKGIQQTTESNEKRRASCLGKNKGKKYGAQSAELIEKGLRQEQHMARWLSARIAKKPG
jgi:hypothetical protein